MRSKLEQAITHLLNEEHDKAEALFHRFMVEQARSIHESLRQGDDPVLDESWDEISEADLDDLEADAPAMDKADDGADDGAADDDAGMADDDSDDADADDDAVADAGDELADDLSDADDAADDADDDAAAADDAADDDSADEESVDERVEDLEAQLEKLTAEFEQMMAEQDPDGSDGAVEDHAEDADMADAVEDDMETRKVTEDALDDEFEDITESVLDDLDAVSVKNEDGLGADGSKQGGNPVSPVPTKRPAAKPVEIRSSKHTDYDREPAPPTVDAKVGRNARKKAGDGMSAVPPGGDKKAKLNKSNYDGE